MEIAVLNGSPKGDASVTMQYVKYIGNRFPEHDLSIHNVAQRIKTIEKNEDKFMEIIDDIRSADAVIWAFPLYILLVCSQYKRFIELIHERNVRDAFKAKQTVSLSTSINFFDITAHNYIRSICEDLNMNYNGYYSANMYDLMKKSEQDRLTLFAEDFFNAVTEQRCAPKRYAPVSFTPEALEMKSPERKLPTGDKKILILTDEQDDEPRDHNIRAMAAYLAAKWTGNVKTINIRDLDIKGPCLGCMRCGTNYVCSYNGRDGFTEFFNKDMLAADIIVIAGRIRYRQLSAEWRRYFDRCFLNTHTPVLKGKQIAILTSGPLGQLQDFQTAYEGWYELQEANLVDFISDEYPQAQVKGSLDSLAEKLLHMSGIAYTRPQSFLGVGGMKIFRDDIHGYLRLIFPADFKTYRKRGYFDFPNRNPLKGLSLSTLGTLLKLGFARKAFTKRMKTSMAMPVAMVADKAKPVTVKGEAS